MDRQDHVFILNRQDVIPGDLNGGKLAPMIVEFDPAGTVVNSWGDPTRLDPRLHSCHVDKDNNIWIASAPSGMVQKYSHDGSKLLLQIGKTGVLDSSDGTAKGQPLNSKAAQFFMPSSIFVHPRSGDAYVSDGEGAGSNRRVAVMDRNGQFLRQWLPDDMETVHCMTIAKSFGRPGSFPGQFNQAHGIAVDSKGNVYIAENRGKRVHTFSPNTPSSQRSRASGG